VKAQRTLAPVGLMVLDERNSKGGALRGAAASATATDVVGQAVQAHSVVGLVDVTRGGGVVTVRLSRRTRPSWETT